jgi:hypothetical protein
LNNLYKEINDAGIGMEIVAEGIKQGRNLAKIRFNCKKSVRTVTTKKRRKKTEKLEASETLELPTIELKTAEQKQEKELVHLRELYPIDFAEFYKVELEKTSFLSATSEIRKIAAEGVALTKLKEKYGVKL